jgi:hypothetical protein
MLDNRDNLVGLVFLVVAGAIAAVLMRAIITGERVRLDLPPAVSLLLGVVFFALIIVGMTRSGMFGRFFGGRGGRQWPDPQTGGKSFWDRIRGR